MPLSSRMFSDSCVFGFFIGTTGGADCVPGGLGTSGLGAVGCWAIARLKRMAIRIRRGIRMGAPGQKSSIRECTEGRQRTTTARPGLTTKDTKEGGIDCQNCQNCWKSQADLWSKKVGVPEAVALDTLALADWNFTAEHGAGVDEGVELAVFAAGIDACREILQKLLIEIASGKFRRKFFRIDADQLGAEAAANHFARQLVR